MHAGPCLPCPLSVPIACACGQVSYTVPCGAERSTRVPSCQGICPIPGTCRHSAQTAFHRYINDSRPLCALHRLLVWCISLLIAAASLARYWQTGMQAVATGCPPSLQGRLNLNLQCLRAVCSCCQLLLHVHAGATLGPALPAASPAARSCSVATPAPLQPVTTPGRPLCLPSPPRPLHRRPCSSLPAKALRLLPSSRQLRSRCPTEADFYTRWWPWCCWHSQRWPGQAAPCMVVSTSFPMSPHSCVHRRLAWAVRHQISTLRFN